MTAELPEESCQPFEALTVSHLSHNGTHEQLDWTCALSELGRAVLARGVMKAEFSSEFVLAGCRGLVDLVA